MAIYNWVSFNVNVIKFNSINLSIHKMEIYLASVATISTLSFGGFAFSYFGLFNFLSTKLNDDD